MIPTPASPSRRAAYERPRWRRLAAIVLSLSIAWQGAAATEPVFGPAPPPKIQRSVLPELGEPSSDDFSPQMERRLGDEIMRQAREAGDVMEDAESTEFLDRFGADLVERAASAVGSQPFRFFLVDDAAVNAFALPGGYIGINAGLIVATRSEAELASVMAHEMGHVLQRHFARAIARDRSTSMMALAATLLGLLAAAKAHSVDGGMAALSAGQGYAIQDQLDFGRDAEREADRVGFQILQDGGWDVHAMATFFGRLQQVTRVYETATPAFLLTHPLTTERIADVQNRLRETPYRQRADSLDFELIRARLRVLQDTTVQGLCDTRTAFEDQLKKQAPASATAVHYGLAFVLLKQGDAKGAEREVNVARGLMRTSGTTDDAIVTNLMIDAKQATGDAAGAIELARQARLAFPLSRMIAQNYADTLQQAGRHDEAIAFLREQLKLYRSEPVLYELMARSYAANGDAMVSHRLLGEGYLLKGSIRAAVQQMQIARQSASPDADFYEVSQIDARVRELQVRADALRKEEKESGVRSLVDVRAGVSTSRVDVDPQGQRRPGLESELGGNLMRRDPVQRQIH